MTEHPEHPELDERLHGAWHDADRLHGVITEALDDGQAVAVVAATRRLREIDHDPSRAVNLLSFVLRACADHAGAEQVLRDHLRAGADDALTWFNFAPLAAWRGDMAGVDAALDRALRCDPDYQAALEWGFRHHRRLGGEEAATSWLWRHARGSWQAHTMLGSHLLAEGEVVRAMEYFDAAHELAPQEPGPLARASSALAEAQYYAELIDFVLDRWRGSHGPVPLMYTIEANLLLGRPASARLGITRLRGITMPAELRDRAADLERRVQRACADAGL